MAVRILMLVAVLMALYGCGLSPETKDSSEGLEPLGSEASVLGTVVLTGQNVEMKVNVVEQADRLGLLFASVSLECGYDGGGPCDDDPLPTFFQLIGLAVLSLLFCALVLPTAYLIAGLLVRLAKRPQATHEPNRLILPERPQATREPTNWLRTAWIGLAVLFFVMVVVPGALLIYQYSGIGD